MNLLFREILLEQIKFHHQFYFSSTFIRVSYEVQYLFWTFGVARNDVLQSCRSLRYVVNNLGSRFLSYY